MATSLSPTLNTSQAAEALLNRARRLSSHAYERSRQPMAFAEGEDHRILSSTPLHHHHHVSFNSFLSDSSRRRSSNIPLRRRSGNNGTTDSLSSTASLSTTTTTTTTTTVSIENTDAATCKVMTFVNATSIDFPPDNEQDHPLSDPASDFHGEDDTSVLSGVTDSTFLDPQHTHSQLYGASDTQPTPLPTARPRALAFEDIGEAQTDISSADQRRKHRSEIEGSSLVHDILVALRQNSELDSPVINQDGSSSEAPAYAPMMGAKMMEHAELPTITASDALDENDTKEVQEINLFSSSQLLKTITPTVPVELIAETADVDTTLLSVLSSPKHAVISDDNTSTALSRSMETTFEIGMVAESPNPPSSSSSTASSQSAGQTEQDKKEAKESKGSLLHRISVRKNSLTESTSTHDFPDSSNTKFLSAGSNHSKSSKRSSRLLGKLVPKFLQTSFTPGIPSTTNSSASLPPAHTSKSGSMASQNAFNKTGGLISADTTSSIAFQSTTSLSTRGSQESLVLETTFEQDEQGFMNTTAPQHLECLRADTRSPSLLGRRLSCSSYASSHNSLSSKPSGTSMSCVDPAESEAKRNAALRGEIDEDEATEAEDDDQEISFTNQLNNSFNEPLPSPYIIDDDCDDAFFLNSHAFLRDNPIHVQLD
ncbi:hypothetical protein BG011_007544 [Mortierella polycephala]|uniref:Uncharacterized protein n=1 Tax=Mortierella polycephala TaxID=41804 RepID=A0A9P6TY18_9FUNG|nr:hypothetical protein BG011_007544 [Mortierella polycephala]